MDVFAPNSNLRPARRVWSPPREAQPSRRPAKKSSASSRGMLHDGWHKDDPTGYVTESGLEYNCSSAASVRPDVQEIEPQGPPLAWQDAEGKSRVHIPDLIVTTVGGERLAVAIKPERRAKAPGFTAMVRSIASTNDRTIADGIKVWDEKTFSRIEIANSSLLRIAFRERDWEADQILDAEIAKSLGARTIGNLIASSSLGSRGYHAVARAIREQRLELVESTYIDIGAAVRRSTHSDSAR